MGMKYKTFTLKLLKYVTSTILIKKPSSLAVNFNFQLKFFCASKGVSLNTATIFLILSDIIADEWGAGGGEAGIREQCTLVKLDFFCHFCHLIFFSYL